MLNKVLQLWPIALWNTIGFHFFSVHYSTLHSPLPCSNLFSLFSHQCSIYDFFTELCSPLCTSFSDLVDSPLSSSPSIWCMYDIHQYDLLNTQPFRDWNVVDEVVRKFVKSGWSSVVLCTHSVIQFQWSGSLELYDELNTEPSRDWNGKLRQINL